MVNLITVFLKSRPFSGILLSSKVVLHKLLAKITEIYEDASLEQNIFTLFGGFSIKVIMLYCILQLPSYATPLPSPPSIMVINHGIYGYKPWHICYKPWHIWL